ncbi:MAG: hypothetical protein IKS45_07845 [Thermoguttaceae bacterium]|nr:hypothetical protein [Thermoguttaceae bacterium]
MLKSITRTTIALTAVVFVSMSCVFAQQPSSQPAPNPDATPTRKLAPHVMYKVDPFLEVAKSFDRHDVAELLAVNPDFEFAKDVSFHRDIWYLEFEFKPVRVIDVDIPQPDGNMKKKKVWYMVYKVRNSGKAFHIAKDEKLSTTPSAVSSETSPYRPMVTYQTDEAFKVVSSDLPVNFAPYFTLECVVKTKDVNTKEYKEVVKKYRERFIPLAVDRIRAREDPAQKYMTSIEMCRTIKPGEEYWGVATWIDVDNTTSKFSICVSGLTNAYRWKDGEVKASGADAAKEIWKNRTFEHKVLKLNFWRPADEFNESDNDIIYGQQGELDYLWVFRPMGT